MEIQGLMYRTPKERVKRGIEWLDKSMDRDKVPVNWRSRIDVEKFRFADPDKGPLGQLFGDYRKGLYKLRIVCGGSDLGFRSQFAVAGDPAELKREWLEALKTEPRWTKLGGSMYRTIKGVRFIIYLDWTRNDKRVQVMMYRSNIAQLLPRSYSSYDSAARAVRKMIQNNEL